MKVLVVDDSIVARKLLRVALLDYEKGVVVDSAASAFAAREKTKECRYDLIISDVNMPEESGVDLLKSLIELKIDTPVLFFSSLSMDSIQDSLELLGLGCLDIVRKPSENNPTATIQYIKDKVFPFLKISAPKVVQTSKSVEVLTPKNKMKPFPTIVNCLVIGGSTGSPAAIEIVLRDLGKINIPVLISIHMPKLFTESFAKRLSNVSDFPVKVAVEGEKIQPGICYVARGGDSLKIEKNGSDVLVKYVDIPGPGLIFPSVDVLFESASEVYKSRVVGVTLTGMGKDGLEGTKVLKNNGGVMYIQDKQSCVVFGMPGAIFDADLADGIFPVGEIPTYLARNLNKRGGL